LRDAQGNGREGADSKSDEAMELTLTHHSQGLGEEEEDQLALPRNIVIM
jgi:hypothetical protein